MHRLSFGGRAMMAAALVGLASTDCAFLLDSDTLASDAGKTTSTNDAAHDGTTDTGAPHDDAGSPRKDAGSTHDASRDHAVVDDTGVDAPLDSHVSAGDAGVPRSCSVSGHGIDDCGPGESCCTSLPVDGGSYARTYTNTGTTATGEANPASVSSLRLDKYQVTVGRFRQFVNAVTYDGGIPDGVPPRWVPDAGSGKHTHLNGGKGLVAAIDGGAAYEPGWFAGDDGTATYETLTCPGGGAGTFTPAPGSNDLLPVDCVNWWQAYEFCIWDGGFLPSEAEWEYAAAGGRLEREFPWGSTQPGANNEYAIYDCYYPDQSACIGNGNIANVGTATKGAGFWGHLDLGGELYEWTLDWFAPYGGHCADCAQLSSGLTDAAIPPRVLRGGNFSDDGTGTSELLPPSRKKSDPEIVNGAQGFRCARPPL